MPLTVFVTDGDQRPALAIARSLARNLGASVIVGADRPDSLASSSRHCARHVTYPSPASAPEAFSRFLLDFLAREKVDVVLPVTDVTTHAVCARQEAIGRFAACAVPSLAAFEFASDKCALLRQASRHGVPIPSTEHVDGAAGLAGVIGRVRYPAVVKPIQSRIATPDGWVATGVHYAYSKAELLDLYARTDYLAAHPSLIQQRVVGPGCGVFLLFDRGRPIAEFAHRRLREKPPSGGVSVLCESVPVDPVLREHAVRLLAPLAWHGVAMAEFKQDAETGRTYLMEINGRFWGSLQLAIDAGVDFPALTCALALGRRPARTPAFRPGIKSRWLAGDLDHLLLRTFKRDVDLRLDSSAPSRWRTLLRFFDFFARDVRYDVLSASDPRPFLYECRQNTRALWRLAAEHLRARRTRPARADRPRVICTKVPASGN